MDNQRAEKSYYEILGVQKNDDVAIIKKAWYRLSMKYHPDKAINKAEGEEKMKDINEAYSVLSDSEKRAIYDKFGKKGLQDMGVSDPLSQMFTRHTRQDVVPPIQVLVELSLENLYSGVTVTKQYQRKIFCKSCDKTGSKDKIKHTCATCRGKGRIVQQIQRGPIIQQIAGHCPQCNGTGIELGIELCESCKGSLFNVETCSVTHVITSGFRNGDTIEIKDLGHEIPSEFNIPGRKYGDVVLMIKELPHAFFKRIDTNDADLAINLTISLAEALCGFKRTIEHLDGRKLAIIENESVEIDETRMIKGEGMPRKSNNILRGNLIIQFNIEFPKSLSLDQKKIIYSCLNDRSFDTHDLSVSPDHIMTHMVPFREDDADEHPRSSGFQQVNCPVQ